MSLETIYYITQIIAVVAVIASLLFVGLQVRQNTKAQHLVAQQNYYFSKNEFVGRIADDPTYADIYRRGLQNLYDLSETERWRFGAMMQLSFDTALTGFKNPDALGEGIVEAWEITLRPGSIQWWENGRSLYPEDFQAWVDNAIESTQKNSKPRAASTTGGKL